VGICDIFEEEEVILIEDAHPGSESFPVSSHESRSSEASIDYSVITATLNEAENIVELIQAITRQLVPLRKNFEIIVVDDNSSDGTATFVRNCSAADTRVKLVSRSDARGIGSAYLSGIEHSTGRVVCTMDADFSHPPEMLPQLLQAADQGFLALGSRFLRRGDFDTLWYRWLPTRSANFWHSLVLRSGIRDHTNGYMAVKREVLKHLLDAGNACGVRPFDRILYCLALVALAKRTGQHVVEVPTKYVFRTRGETKIKFGRGVRLFFFEWADSLRLALNL
jgi:dolichol-phosphate mannosyltransferase